MMHSGSARNSWQFCNFGLETFQALHVGNAMYQQMRRINLAGVGHMIKGNFGNSDFKLERSLSCVLYRSADQYHFANIGIINAAHIRLRQ